MFALAEGLGCRLRSSIRSRVKGDPKSTKLLLIPYIAITYLLRDGAPVCTTCGAVVGGTDADQIRHSTWHTSLAALFAVADAHRPAVEGR